MDSGEEGLALLAFKHSRISVTLFTAFYSLGLLLYFFGRRIVNSIALHPAFRKEDPEKTMLACIALCGC